MMSLALIIAEITAFIQTGEQSTSKYLVHILSMGMPWLFLPITYIPTKLIYPFI